MPNNNSGKEKEKTLHCSFCGKSQDDVERMIIGPGVNICNECITLCHSLLDEEGKPDVPPKAGPGRRGQSHAAPTREPVNVLTPAEIKAGLDQYVIGQDEAKRVLAVSVYNHYKRILSGQGGDVELQKSNVLLLGPSGVGKTLLAQTLAKMLGVPFAIADATTLTEAGSVGEDVENILFICGGAFDGLEKYIQRRTDTSALGFNSQLKDTSLREKQNLLRKVEPHDLVKFGLIPELIGRLPVVTVLDPLDEDALIRVLKEPKDSIVKQYQALFRMDNVELEFTDEALRAVAKKTIERKSGARGLRSVVEGLLIPIMFEVPSDPTIIRVIVTPEAVEGDKPQLEYGAVRKRYKSTVPVV